MVRSGIATVNVSSPAKIATTLEIYVTDLNWNIISICNLGERYRVVAVLRRADTGEPVKDKTVYLTITPPGGPSVKERFYEQMDGHYYYDFNALWAGLFQYQAEFAGDETYEGCGHHAEAELAGVGVFEW